MIASVFALHFCVLTAGWEDRTASGVYTRAPRGGAGTAAGRGHGEFSDVQCTPSWARQRDL